MTLKFTCKYLPLVPILITAVFVCCCFCSTATEALVTKTLLRRFGLEELSHGKEDPRAETDPLQKLEVNCLLVLLQKEIWFREVVAIVSICQFQNRQRRRSWRRKGRAIWVCFTAMGLTTYPPPHPIILPCHRFENLKKSHSWTPTHPPTSFSPTVHLNQTKKSLGYFLKKINIIKAQTETFILNFLDSDIWPIFIYDPKIAH